jgi:hypothetical protein
MPTSRALRSLAPLFLLLTLQAAAAHPILHEIPHESSGEHSGDRDRKSTEGGGILPDGGVVHVPDGFVLRTVEKIRNARLAAQPSPIEIVWKATALPGGGHSYAAYRTSDVFTQPPAQPPAQPRPLTPAELQAYINGPIPVLHSGDVPHGRSWQELTAHHADTTVIRDPASPNRSERDIKIALDLTSHALDTSEVKVFNALPQETAPAASLQERQRMGIVGSTKAWQNLNETLSEQSQGFPHRAVATREALLDELHYGHSPVIIVYAHFDGERLLMPTLGGRSISVQDIASLDRIREGTVPDRVIILAACSTAAPAHGASLASVLLKQGLARTVLATDHPYDARDIPALIAHLRSGSPIRGADSQLRQYVRLSSRPRPTPSPLQPTEVSADE